METLYAYLAGAIDIDGRISISRAGGYRRDGKMTYYSTVVTLSDSDPVAVGERAREPLIRLLPYFRIKRRQAELALSLITLMQSDKAGSARPLSEEQQQARRLLYEQVRSLNASRPQQTYR